MKKSFKDRSNIFNSSIVSLYAFLIFKTIHHSKCYTHNFVLHKNSTKLQQRQVDEN